jgi:hypothetical protein
VFDFVKERAQHPEKSVVGGGGGKEGWLFCIFSSSLRAL